MMVGGNRLNDLLLEEAVTSSSALGGSGDWEFEPPLENVSILAPYGGMIGEQQ